MALQKAMVSSKSNEWDTPISFFKLLDDEFNFTLDPCCREDTAKCKKFYTIVEDGLKQDWSHDTVFMNPPYGGHTGDWIKKALEESRRGATVVCLIVSSTDRSYWHEYIFPFASQVRFIRGRIKFGNSKSTAPFASAVVIFSQKEYAQKIVYYSRSINKQEVKAEYKEDSHYDGFPPNNMSETKSVSEHTQKSLISDELLGIQPTILR